MVAPRDPPKKAWGQVADWLAAAPKGALAELVCRAGFLSRGAVYLSLGGVALLAVAGQAPTAEGPVDALEGWAEWPAGRLLLWLIGLGLFGFAGWRALQSLFDADRQGTGWAALANRAGQAISGLVHASLGYGVFNLLDALSEFREHEEAEEAQQTVAQALQAPGGELAVIAVGLFVMGVGIGNLVQAAGRPQKHLVCPGHVARLAGLLGRAGHLGRGLAFLPLGYAFVRAGREASAAPAQGLGAALEALGRLPYGDLLLGLVALGLAAFGLFALLEARYRRLDAAEVVDDLTDEAPASRPAEIGGG